MKPSQRTEWFNAAWQSLRGSNLVFADPDNGIEPAGFTAGSRKSIKSITLREIRELLCLGGPAVIYHHSTRFRGGHEAEINHLGEQLKQFGGCVCAIRARMYSPRVFFIVGADSASWSAAVRRDNLDQNPRQSGSESFLRLQVAGGRSPAAT